MGKEVKLSEVHLAVQLCWAGGIHVWSDTAFCVDLREAGLKIEGEILKFKMNSLYSFGCKYSLLENKEVMTLVSYYQVA